MRKQLLIVCLASLGICSFSCHSCKKKAPESTVEVIRDGFKEVPDSVRLAVYWYWMSDNISVRGVEEDLESMKKAGITRAFIGNIGGQGVPYGKVKIFSDEWWKILHAALKKATELDIEIGIFNSPGWSQSGGPWIKPSESMRYLASADTLISGGKNLKIILPEVSQFPNKWEQQDNVSSTYSVERNIGQDVRVIAYKSPSIASFQTRTINVKKRNGEEKKYELSLDNSEPIRSILFYTNSPVKTSALLYNNGVLLDEIDIDRSNLRRQTGFNPTAPIVISVPSDLSSKNDKLQLQFKSSGGCDLIVKYSSKPMIERYAEKSLSKMFPRPLPMFNDYLWRKQPQIDSNFCIDPKEVIDLTENVKDGVLTWDFPEGNWIVSRTAMLTTEVSNAPSSPEGRGLEVDKMSKTHIKTHFDAFIGEILRRIPEEDRKTFKVVVQDSYETGGQNWTDTMIEDFKNKYNYDPVPFLPVLNGAIVGSPDISDRFLWDLRRLVADKVSYDYVGGLREISHKHGLTTWLENYGHWGFPGEFLQYGGQSDEVAGEFWSEGTLGDIENKAASSCAHIYGKRKVWAESCTAGGKAFARYPKVMKQRVDRFFTEGINATLLHLYIQQFADSVYPGINAPFGNEFNRKNTWFNQMNVFSDYLRRSNYMLQQGLYVADVAYFIGEDTPKMTGECNPKLPQGYSYDFINAEVLLTRATVKDSKLVLPDGMSYRLLVLPDLETIRPEVLKKLEELVSSGLAIVGKRPLSSPSLQDYPHADTVVEDLSKKMWNDKPYNHYGKGLIFNNTQPIQDILNQLNVKPDFDLRQNPNAPLLYIHRSLSDGDIYFISNQSEKIQTISPIFRVDNNKHPELWNPVTGEIKPLSEYSIKEGGIEVPIQFEALESAFIVFTSKKNRLDISKKNIPTHQQILSLNNKWNVTFKSVYADPFTLTMDSLTCWTKLKDNDLCYHSGEAVYEKGFNFDFKDLNKDIYLDLGNVMVMATVKLNGKYVGGVWTPPYRLRINDYIKSGDNKIQITVVNNWINRIIGDLNLPENERKTSVIINPWKKDTPLQESGLLGPVQIYYE